MLSVMIIKQNGLLMIFGTMRSSNRMMSTHLWLEMEKILITWALKVSIDKKLLEWQSSLKMKNALEI